MIELIEIGSIGITHYIDDLIEANLVEKIQ